MSTHKKRHHYVSQGYLRGFTASHPEQLTTLFLDQRKHTANNIKNIAQENHFNRLISPKGADDSLEDIFAKEIENPAFAAIDFLSNSPNFDGDARKSILILMAMFFLNNPETREMRNTLSANLLAAYLSILQNHEGNEVNGLLITKEIIELIPRLKIDVEVHQNEHILGALKLINDVANSMNFRKWILFQAPAGAEYITCDTPVKFRWSIEDAFNIYPGYDCLNTHVLFPLSKKLALMGNFDGNELTCTATPEIVGIINTNIIANARNQVYTGTKDFYFTTPSGNLLNGVDDFWKHYGDH